MEGWIKLHRSIVEWKWITSPNHVLVFIQILARANYKESQWRKETVKPGQLLTGTKQISQWTGLSEMKVRRCLRDLASTSEITIKPTNKFSIITICNWDEYQDLNNQTTFKEQTSDTQTTTSKKYNKYNKAKNNNTPTLFEVEAPQIEEELSVSQKASNAITMLNSLCFKNFRPVAGNLKHINARLNEGYTLEDFKKVIQYKQEQWGNDPKFRVYLRPETIFGTKFDSYLAEASDERLKEISDDEIIRQHFPGWSA